MRRPASRVQVLRRIDDVKGRLEQPTPRPLDGQEAIDLNPPTQYEQPPLDEDLAC